MANKELFNIRKRTKQGIRNAKESGRYLGRALFGYKNVIDGTKRNLIEIDKPRTLIVEHTFKDYIAGLPQYIIYKNAKAMGCTLTGKSTIQSILQNCVYAGLIKVPALGELPEKYVKGLHDPIISDAEFWLVQNMLATAKRCTRVQPAEDSPLRGVLKCWCGKSMTAGWSKGRKNYHLYYRCTTHTNYNLPGAKLHEAFEKMLKALSFQPHQIRFLIETAKTMLIEPQKLKQLRQKEKVEALQAVNKKIYNLEERLMNNEIENTTYQTWFKKFRTEKAALKYALSDDKKSKVEPTDDIIERLLPELSNIFQIYKKGNIIQKHTLIRGGKDNLSWGEEMFRTTFVDPVFYDNVLKVKEKGLLFYEQPFQFSNLKPVSTQTRRTHEPILT